MTSDEVKKAAEDRNSTIAALRKALKERTGKVWSVTGGRGTAWGWITVDAPPRRHVDGYLSEAERAELAAVFGEGVSHQGVSIPASSDYRLMYLEKAAGLPVSKGASPYWD